MAAQKKRYKITAVHVREDDCGFYEFNEQFLGYASAVSEAQAKVFVSRRTGVWPKTQHGTGWAISTRLEAMEV